ncbi:hypothetical protein EYF80_049548 [Liparis tanakae]|uniref:Uncharacterized protein n=1 Tax=Liparis tanakae TaxID=230148 RepID=A0A4Z2FH92_9TELE|nr:hypothetical protein EYF80_049548 [Liparis tanakae]
MTGELLEWDENKLLEPIKSRGNVTQEPMLRYPGTDATLPRNRCYVTREPTQRYPETDATVPRNRLVLRQPLVVEQPTGLSLAPCMCPPTITTVTNHANP